jgi:hypothetical protein
MRVSHFDDSVISLCPQIDLVPSTAGPLLLFWHMVDTSDENVRRALGDGFPKHPLHQIVCIGALVAGRTPEN